MIEKWTTTPWVSPGDNATFKVRIKNVGTGKAVNVLITDEFLGSIDGRYFNHTGSIKAVEGSGTGCVVNCSDGACDEREEIFNVTINGGNMNEIQRYEYCIFEYNATVPSDIPDGMYSNYIKVNQTGASLEQSDVAYVLVLSKTNLYVEKELTNASQTTAQPGDLVEYTITVTNTGKDPIENVQLTDYIPHGWETASGDGCTLDSCWGAEEQSGDITCNVSDVGGAGNPQNVSKTICLKVTSSASCGPTENKVKATADKPDGTDLIGTDKARSVEVLKPNLMIEKWTTTPWVSAGDMVNYTIRVKNVGCGGDAENVVVTDTLPPGFTADTVSATCLISGDAAGPWTITGGLSGGDGNMGLAGECTITLTANVSGTQQDGAYMNLVKVDYNDTNSQQYLAQYDEAYITVSSKVNLMIEKTANTTEAQLGDYVNFTIDLFNTGENPLYNVILTDSLPYGWVLTSYSSNLISVSNNTVTQVYVFNLSSSLANDTPTETWIVARINSTAACGHTENKVRVEGNAPDGTLLFETDKSQGIYVKCPTLEIMKWCNVESPSSEHRASPYDATSGDQIECFIKLENKGTGDLTNVIVTDRMPAGWKYMPEYSDEYPDIVDEWNLPVPYMTVDPSNATGSNYTSNTVYFRNITLLGGPYNGGDVKMIRYVAYITDNVTPGINWNCVNATGTDGDTTEYIAKDDYCVPINIKIHKPKLEIVKDMSQRDVEPGSEPLTTIIIENPTYAPIKNIMITDYLPRGFNYTRGTAKLDGVPISDPDVVGNDSFPCSWTNVCGEPGDGTMAGLNLTWEWTNVSQLATMPPKTIYVLTFRTHVKCSVCNNTFNNTVNITGRTGDGDPIGPNSTSFEMQGYLAIAQLHKYASTNSPTFFEYVDYTIVIWNDPRGANIAPLVLADVMPSYLKYVPGYARVGDIRLEPTVCGDYTDKNNGTAELVQNGTSQGDCTTFIGSLTSAGTTYLGNEMVGDRIGQTLFWNLSKWLFLTPGQQVAITYRTQVIPGIRRTAQNNVTLSYLDPEHPDLCPDCEFNMSSSTLIGVIGEEVATTENAATSYTLALNKGWNLISIPIKPDDPSVSAVLSQIEGKYTDVANYEKGQWIYRSYAYGDWFGELESIEPGKGYWLYMKDSAEIEVTGTTDYDRTITLYGGWNLIGYTSTEPQALSTALKSINGKYIDVATWNNGQWKYHSYAYGDWFGELSTIEPGKGYWLNMAKGNSQLV
ncbi:hypothetical protein BEH94_02510 [Candidatus Altiarchaeales archaeon WOR_SM1_SCG]|nr:hypothetical protein BEH94_02510 [Candidatus Altiarchaeales archaeon WOR_SM1_SCG]